MECVHCGSILKTESSLKQHQKTAKYCLIKQNKPINYEYTCCFCNTAFTLKSSLHKHVRTCKANTPILQILNEKMNEISSVLHRDTFKEFKNNISLPFGDNIMPIKVKRNLDDVYPISSEYLISFDEGFHRQCVKDILDKRRDFVVYFGE